MISNCGSDERGQYHSGKAGDQTGNEWRIRDWYNSNWKCVARHPDAKIREMIASYAEKAAKNNHIGYDQWQRYTYWENLVENNYNPEAISKDCETDCSAGIAANLKAIGYVTGNDGLKGVPTNMVTQNARSYLRKAGFSILTANKYLSSPDQLLRGDILLNDDHHMATNITNGSKIQNDSSIPAPKKSVEEIANEVIKGLWGNGSDRKNRLESAGYNYQEVQDMVNKILKVNTPKPSTTQYKVRCNTVLNIRSGPGTSYSIVGQFKNGTIISVKTIKNSWAQLENGNWVSANYIVKA